MERKRVESSNLEAVGYDSRTRILEIEFKDGSVYQYSNVPESEYNGLMRASSHGQYFDANIKKAGYRYSKVR